METTTKDFFDQLLETLESTNDLNSFLDSMKQLLIIFNTDPNLYSKKDYLNQILKLTSGFKYVYNTLT